jgi:hypothetical protein
LKTSILLPKALLVIVVVSVVAVYGYGQNYTTIENEEMYGTWINSKSINTFHIQKMVVVDDDFKEYGNVIDSSPRVDVTQQIDSKWTDDTGNLWYKVYGKINTGPWKGSNFKALEKLSENSSVLEMVVNAFQGNIDSANYPDKIEHNSTFNGGYRIFYRSQ